MSTRNRSRCRSTVPETEASMSNREPYAILWLDDREICLYDEGDLPEPSEQGLN
nr:hypothetical protein [Desulfuromonadales bacterium]